MSVLLSVRYESRRWSFKVGTILLLGRNPPSWDRAYSLRTLDDMFSYNLTLSDMKGLFDHEELTLALLTL